MFKFQGYASVIIEEHVEVQEYLAQTMDDVKETEDELINAIMEIDDIKEVFDEKYRYMDEGVKRMIKRSGLVKAIKDPYA